MNLVNGKVHQGVLFHTHKAPTPNLMQTMPKKKLFILFIM